MASKNVVAPPAEGLCGKLEFEVKEPASGQPKWYKPTTGLDKGLKVMNTLTNELEAFVPGKDNKVLWYTCGPTVYDACHMGHARAYLTFDILRRITEDYFKYDLLYHVNITDIDDKIIMRSRVNHLIDEYIAEKNDFKTVLEKVTVAMNKKQVSLDKKGEVLAKDLPETAIKRELVALKEQREVHALKLNHFKEASANVAAAAKGTDSAALVAAGRAELGELLDEEKGASVTDHSVFLKHAKKYEKEYFEDMTSLGIKEPDVLTRVTEYVPQIVDFIQKIIDKGLAYESKGSVYLSIDAFKEAGHDYRKLVPGVDTTAEEMAEGEGALAADGEKKNPNDFALWKKSKVGEPEWKSQWGMGRPGWHIECSVVASDILGPVMDVHAGGCDLRFPHHDNELAQSEAHFGHGQWVNYFFHAGHLKIKGLKMSKSLKNFVTIRQALEKFTAREIRMMFLLQPWNKEMNFSDQTVDDAKSKEKTFREFFHKVHEISRISWDQLPVGLQNKEKELELLQLLFTTQETVHNSFCNNFNTPAAILAMNDLVGAFNKYVHNNDTPSVHVTKKIGTYITSIFRILGLVAGGDDIGFGQEASGGNKDDIAKFLDVFVNFRTELRNIAKSKGSDLKDVLGACDKIRDVLPPLGAKINDLDGGKSTWQLDDPAVLVKEMNERKEREAEAAVKKLEALLSKQEKTFDKLKKFYEKGTPDLMFKNDAQYEGFAFDAEGYPEKQKDGEPVSVCLITNFIFVANL